MYHLWIFLHTHLIRAWESLAATDYLWGAIALLATGWFLSTLNRA
jgi:hypothetical protein